MGKAFSTQLQPMVLEPQQVILPAVLPASLKKQVICQRQTSTEIHFPGSEKGLFSSSNLFSAPPSLVGIEHHSIATPSTTLQLTLSQNPLDRRKAVPTPGRRPTDVEQKQNKLEKWEEISGLRSRSLSLLWLFEVSFGDWLLLPVALILLLLFLHLTLNYHVFQHGRNWNRALPQEHRLMKAVVPSLAPLTYFHPKSHPPSSQGSPREQRHPLLLQDMASKQKLSYRVFCGNLFTTYSPNPQFSLSRAKLEEVFCVSVLHHHHPNTCNIHLQRYTRQKECAGTLRPRSAARRAQEGHLSALADSLLIVHLRSLQSHTHLQLSSFMVK